VVAPVAPDRGDGDVMTGLSHLSGIAKVGLVRNALGAAVIRKARAAPARQRRAHMTVGGIDEEALRISAERALGRTAVLVNDLPALEPPGADQAVCKRCHRAPPAQWAVQSNRSRSTPKRQAPRPVLPNPDAIPSLCR
jgi:hypothetical protein